jgi:hypothetical protein
MLGMLGLGFAHQRVFSTPMKTDDPKDSQLLKLLSNLGSNVVIVGEPSFQLLFMLVDIS